MGRLFHLILGSAQAHPQLALAIVGFVAFAESVAIVGTFVPTAVVMFAGGALVGQGVLGLAPTLLAAIAGAVAGDALSFELGRRYDRQVRAWPILRRHLAAVGAAEDFIRRHGALSIVLARFAGAVRAFVPLLAGVGHMRRLRFYLTNAGSALLWAPVHVLPGVLFGGSLQLAEAVSGRLAVMLLLLIGLMAVAVWLVTRGVRWLVPPLRRARQGLLVWAGRHDGRLSRLTLSLLDPERPGSHTLLLGSVLLIGAGWLFLGLLQDVIAGDPIVQADHAVFTFFQALRTEPVDGLMVVITEMGSAAVLLPVILVTAAWLLMRGARRTMVFWVGSVAVGELLVLVLKLSLGRERPSQLYAGVDSFSFPSGHATMSTVVLGFLAFLLTRGASASWRTLVFGITASELAMVALSRLYLGAHWLSDVLAGMSLGLVWVAFGSMVYTHRHIDEPLGARPLAALVGATVIAATAVWHGYRGAADKAFYAVQQAPMQTVLAATPSGWPGVPRQRRELGGNVEERFGLQWACSSPVIQETLGAGGWLPAPAWRLKAVLGALTGRQPLQDTPVLPRFDRGQPNALAFVRTTGDEGRQVLRLWRSTIEQGAGSAPAQPIWYGALYDERRLASGPLKGLMHMTAVETKPAKLVRALGAPSGRISAAAAAELLMLVCR